MIVSFNGRAHKHPIREVGQSKDRNVAWNESDPAQTTEKQHNLLFRISYKKHVQVEVYKKMYIFFTEDVYVRDVLSR